MKVALTGNPNTGKSTIFNFLTGLSQKVGNFPGVTVDKRTGTCYLNEQIAAFITDLPGAYSINPRSADEFIAIDLLTDTNHEEHPDLVVVVADASNLKRNLLLFSQIADLKVPVVLALNMMDSAARSGITIDVGLLSEKLGIPVIPMNAREGKGIEELKAAMLGPLNIANGTHIDLHALCPEILDEVKQKFKLENDFKAFELCLHYEQLKLLSKEDKKWIQALLLRYDFNAQKLQAKETIARYNYINDLLYDCLTRPEKPDSESFSNSLDRILTHRIWGFAIFFLILFVVFQSIFSFARYPMDAIDHGFLWLRVYLKTILPTGILSSLFCDGILSGLSGVVVFIPQIVILFAFIAVLEDTGYMARVSFMMDRLMKKVGLNGKSVVPLMSGIACAVPAIMATRTIENKKDRLITMLVTPLMSCSARLPVYTLLISLAVPDKSVWGIIRLQGLTLMALYLLGFVAAIGSSLIMKKIIASREKGYFMMELPVYRLPRWSNIGMTLFNQARTFAVDAGKVIIAVAVILWVLASFAPGNRFEQIEHKYAAQQHDTEINSKINAEKLEASYAGSLGKAMEPVIKPLGFDWKIGIALITSFAAREVFVGTMATIYSVEGDEGNLISLKEKMREAKNQETGQPVFTLPVAISLMIFFAFAMQCMSTFAVVYRETKSLKWPIIQFAFMGILAYISSFLAYQLFR